MTNKMLLAVAGLAAFVSYSFYRGQCANAAKTEIKEDLGRWGRRRRQRSRGHHAFAGARRAILISLAGLGRAALRASRRLD